MYTPPLTALVSTDEDGIHVLSPAVGSWYVDLFPGRPVRGGDRIGRLQILNRMHPLILPSDLNGRIWLAEQPDHVIPVAYRQELCRVVSEEPGNTGTAAISPAEAEETISAGDGLLIKAFTTGIFYRKPSPDAPPYVDEGQTVEPGKVLGLIEVMKSFNQIVFAGEEGIRHGKVARIFVDDGEEVKLGQPLFLIHEH
jgi:acetyl-CoA carboxylase biotin carboxyl carrier protein